MSSFSASRKPMVSQNIPNLHSAIARRSHYRAVICRTYGKAWLLLLVGELRLSAAKGEKISCGGFWSRCVHASHAGLVKHGGPPQSSSCRPSTDVVLFFTSSPNRPYAHIKKDHFHHGANHIIHGRSFKFPARRTSSQVFSMPHKLWPFTAQSCY